ncbi:MAG: PH domain-containing protein [Prevotellaceae bacterium]|jgi:hypothetical protein|nr:PH domain-containing protein [Prevotellaceae bacterium]
MNKFVFDSKSTPDTKAWMSSIISITICISVFFVIGTVSLLFYDIVIGFLLLIVVFGILYTPYRYMLTETALMIKRYFGNITIPLTQIQEIRLFADTDKKGIIRAFGVGGFAGNYGIFSSNIHKILHVYTRRNSNWTLIVTPQKKYVIAPNDIHFIEAVQEQIKKNELSLHPINIKICI